MAKRFMRAVAGVSCTFCALSSIAAATPNAAFPFNSQVPAVARTNQQYEFQISDSTFAPESQSYVYSLSNQPAWLTIDSATRTLKGTPGASDAGAQTFTLTAADQGGAAHMQCTLVISSDPAPQLTGDISEQLAETADLSSSHPPIVTLLPSTTFNFDFQQESFIDIIQRQLYYYATLADHTPLPAWLKFDSERLIFSGTAPALSAFPQSWNVTLIASDVTGFAGTTSSFTIAIGTQQLVFVPEEQEVIVTPGKAVNITLFKNQLYRNKAELATTEIQTADADAPSWLTFNPSTLELEGEAPSDFEGANFTVTVTDKFGNHASVVLDLVAGNSSLFNGQIGTLVARAGQSFHYEIVEPLLNQPEAQLSVDIPGTASWLSYDSNSRELVGEVPESAEAERLQLTLTASLVSEERQTQAFTIDVRAATTTGTSGTAPDSASASATADPAANSKLKKGLQGGIIAAIVIASIIGGLLIIALLVWFCRRRRKTDSYVRRSPSPSKSSISRPVPPQATGNNIAVTSSVEQDVEGTAGMESASSPSAPAPPSRQVELPPQIQLNLPSHFDANKRRSRWSKRFSRISHASSLGVGEDAIRADENIPELGMPSAALHTPHDSFGIPTEMARASRNLEDTSPSKRSQALKKLRDRRSRPLSGIGLKRPMSGLGVEGMMSGGISRQHSSRTQRRHRKTTSSFGALTTTMEASSAASLRTTRTSILSARVSDFPAPPPSKHSTALSVYTLAAPAGEENDMTSPKRKSIRHVGRSDSVADPRPLDIKRQSFIKNRASASWNSPLFAHGSRSASTSTRQTTGQKSSTNESSFGSVRRSRPGTKRSLMTTYTESSSIEPKGHADSPHRDSRRFSQRLRETFAPDYPRMAPGVGTKSTLYGDCIDEGESSGSWQSMTSDDWRNELSKPRAERNFVLPGEASPTPPPAPPSSLQPTAPGSRCSTPSGDAGAARQQRWRDRQSRESSASPLSQNVLVIGGNSSPSRHAKTNSGNRMSAPISLVSSDSMHNGRPRMGQRSSAAKRPASVEDVKRLSSMRADAVGGSEREESRNWMAMGWESDDELKGAGLILPLGGAGKGDTMRSDLTGPAFL